MAGHVTHIDLLGKVKVLVPQFLDDYILHTFLQPSFRPTILLLLLYTTQQQMILPDVVLQCTHHMAWLQLWEGRRVPSSPLLPRPLLLPHRTGP